MSDPPVKMDVDNPSSLKRSSSAPMINEINPGGPPALGALRESVSSARPRRFSTSFSPVGAPSSPKLTPRVNQLRREESVDLLGRETAHERELHSAMVISQSWEDLTLVQPETKSDGESKGLYVSLCPSPTRTLKPCFLTSAFKPTSSPSPTRKFATRRSQSPIAMRPSPLGGSVKRKFELDEPEPSAKRGGLLAQPKLEVGLRRVECSDQPMPDANKTD